MGKTSTFKKTTVEDFVSLHLTGLSFPGDGAIPARYTCDGININPALHIDHIPENAQSLAVIVDDPDAPGGSFCHWVIWNIPVTQLVKEKESRGVTGMNSYGFHRYHGPCPSTGTHRYFLNVYALDTVLTIPLCSHKEDLEQAMAGHVLGYGVLIGHYRRGGGA